MAYSTDKSFQDVEFGEELPAIQPDISLDNVKLFAQSALMLASRFTDHEAARKTGLPGAIVPGIMSQGILVALIHRWAPNARILNVDTIFRAPLIVDTKTLLQFEINLLIDHLDLSRQEVAVHRIAA